MSCCNYFKNLSDYFLMKEEKLQKTTFQEMCIRTKFDLVYESCLEFLFNTPQFSSLGART